EFQHFADVRSGSVPDRAMSGEQQPGPAFFVSALLRKNDHLSGF
ncbi:hypothetical protein CLOSTHATH_02295, partial [Hungatella hathewayi DSM 13479]